MTAILRKRTRSRFTQVPNATVRDCGLSFRALGVLTHVLSLRDGSPISAERLAKTHREGRDAVSAALKELSLAGYYRTTKRQNEAGRWVTEAEMADERGLLDQPLSEANEDASPDTGFQGSVPDTDSQGSVPDPDFPGFGAPGPKTSRPNPEDSSSSSSSDARGLPAGLWKTIAEKKAQATTTQIVDLAAWVRKTAVNTRAEHLERAVWLWETYEITESQLVDVLLAGGSSPLLSILRKRDAA